uniref:NADH dehydrogenase subunit 2 n=1 Tax=Heterakis beramporia TaxID=596434 RepID=A0A142I171_9BILA|nr:NADH dehydrogenase subunit 2 [Heterakis beramporia]AMR36302.1 NADH dehydrogenase subunit 2 [Heterakis beramporia]
MFMKMLGVLLLSLLSFCSSNFFVWGSGFVLMTMIFLLVKKLVGGSSGIINYFVIQESLGLFFLVFSGSFLQFLLVMMKIGVAPLHFWIFSVTNGLSNWCLMWFLTFQKLPFFSVLILLGGLEFVFLILFGIVLCYSQIFMTKSYKNLFVLSSTESFNWILLLSFVSLLSVVYLFLYYFVVMVLLIVCFYQKEIFDVSWETILIFMNIPFGVSFFIKIFSLGSVLVSFNFFLLFLLFVMFLATLSIGFWVIQSAVKDFSGVDENYKVFYYLLFPLTMCVLF